MLFAGVFGGGDVCAGSKAAIGGGGDESKFMVKASTFFSVDGAFSDPSLAVDEDVVVVVGARPESLFFSSWGVRKAGWVSDGGARGGATITGRGAFAATESS